MTVGKVIGSNIVVGLIILTIFTSIIFYQPCIQTRKSKLAQADREVRKEGFITDIGEHPDVEIDGKVYTLIKLNDAGVDSIYVVDRNDVWEELEIGWYVRFYESGRAIVKIITTVENGNETLEVVTKDCLNGEETDRELKDRYEGVKFWYWAGYGALWFSLGIIFIAILAFLIDDYY